MSDNYEVNRRQFVPDGETPESVACSVRYLVTAGDAVRVWDNLAGGDPVLVCEAVDENWGHRVAQALDLSYLKARRIIDSVTHPV